MDMRRLARSVLAGGLVGLVLFAGVAMNASPAAADSSCILPPPGSPPWDWQTMPGDIGVNKPICGDDPVGRFESAQLVNHATQVEVTGWAIDPNTTNPVTIQVIVGTKIYRVIANVNRPDLAGFLSYGTKHGFHAILGIPSTGATEVWATAMNIGPGKDTRLRTKKL